MSARVYFRLALLLPLVVPALAIAGRYLLPGSGTSTVTALLAYQLAYGAPGYLFFVPAVLFFARRRSPGQLAQLALLLPLAFIPFCAASFWLVTLLMGATVDSLTLSGFVRFLPFVALYSVVFGYAYVLLGFVGFAFLWRKGAHSQPHSAERAP
jgi:hypothetical protein